MVLPVSLFRRILVFFLCLGVGDAVAQNDSCWAIQFDGNDISWSGYLVPNIAKVVKVADGIVVGGSTHEHVFPSRDGDSIGRTNYGGLFIAKYDFDGNLQWLDYGIDPYYISNNPKTQVLDMAADPDGNIYFSAFFPAHDTFYTDSGQTAIVLAPTMNGEQGIIAKLNPDGQLLWRSQVNGDPLYLDYSADGRVVVSGPYGNYATNYIVNGDWTSAVYIGQTDVFSPDVYQFIFWIDTADGELLQFTDFRQRQSNASIASAMATDAEGNTILTGRFEYEMCFYTPGRTDSMMLGKVLPAFQHPRMFTVKYDTAGAPLWRVSDRKTWPGSGPQGGCYSFDIATAPNGNIYLNTYQNLQHSNTTCWYYNPDSSMVTYKRRENNLVCLSKDGFFKWTASGGYETIMGFTTDSASIYVIGSSSSIWSSNIGTTDTLYSAGDSNYIHTPHQNPQLILARYDTSGHLLFASRMGVPEPYVNLWNSGGLTEGDSGSFFFYADGETQGPPMTWYGDTMHLNEQDGFILKFTPGVCDSLMYPPGSTNEVVLKGRKSEFFLSPNPANGSFAITGDWSDVSSVEIRSIVGVLVYRENVFPATSDLKSFQLSGSIAPGCYIVRLRSLRGDTTMKVIVE